MKKHETTSPNSIIKILEDIMSENNADNVTVGNIVDHLKNRGFGPLLAILGLLVIIIGAIPLVPMLAGVVIIFINIQMVIGKEHPWIPKYIQNIKIDKTKLEHGIKFAKPYAHKVERMLKMRWEFLFGRISEIITALACIILALIMIAMGFIPMLPAILSLPIFLFGIGYIAQDGLLIAIGFLIIFLIWGLLLLHMLPF